MSVSVSPTRWTHVVAVCTALTALAPIILGAQTTTTNAGMAFPDWPTSDGHGMLQYPWLSSTGAKFLEHGHRLGGALIGLASVVLMLTLHWLDERRWVRRLGYAVLLAVIGQGLLGGQRVVRDALNSRGLAFVHGSTAALVFALMWGVAVVTSRRWRSVADDTAVGNPGRSVAWLAAATWIAIYVQYVLGGLVRHQGQALIEHLVFAFVAGLLVIMLAVTAAASGHSWLRGPSLLAGVVMLLQLALGAGAWITKYGFNDRVAVAGSTEQVAFRTLHVLNGMALFATITVLSLRIFRLRWVGQQTGTLSWAPATETGANPRPTTVIARGGAV
ncbi:MAG: COX15/CtaA family protein [Planctomycetaceae bacterium]